MIRSLLWAVAAGLVLSVLAWFAIPASSYVEDALGILLLVLGGTSVLVFAVLRMRRPKA